MAILLNQGNQRLLKDDTDRRVVDRLMRAGHFAHA
jgi:hypothetical protein